jgi:hypothetical protein
MPASAALSGEDATGSLSTYIYIYLSLSLSLFLYIYTYVQTYISALIMPLSVFVDVCGGISALITLKRQPLRTAAGPYRPREFVRAARG